MIIKRGNNSIKSFLLERKNSIFVWIVYFWTGHFVFFFYSRWLVSYYPKNKKIHWHLSFSYVTMTLPSFVNLYRFFFVFFNFHSFIHWIQRQLHWIINYWFRIEGAKKEIWNKVRTVASKIPPLSFSQFLVVDNVFLIKTNKNACVCICLSVCSLCLDSRFAVRWPFLVKCHLFFTIFLSFRHEKNLNLDLLGHFYRAFYFCSSFSHNNGIFFLFISTATLSVHDDNNHDGADDILVAAVVVVSRTFYFSVIFIYKTFYFNR